MADSDTQDEQQKPAERRFRVKLIQTVEVVSEQFEELDGEPLTGNKKQVLQKVQNFVDDEKDLEEGTYRLEVEEIEEQPATTGDPEAAVQAAEDAARHEIA